MPGFGYSYETPCQNKHGYSFMNGIRKSLAGTSYDKSAKQSISLYYAEIFLNIKRFVLIW